MSQQPYSKIRNPRPQSQRLRDHLRLILAIAAKDILEAIKNKNTITVMISSFFVVIMYWALPFLLHDQEPTRLLIYDAGDSSLVPLLENRGTYRVRSYDSEEQMLRLLAAGDLPELGLSIPADFDQELEAGGTPRLQGYWMNWLRAKQYRELISSFESELQAIYGRPVSLQTEGNIVYMLPDVRGAGVQAAMSITFLLIMVGLTLIAHLMMEEKQAKTIQAIMVSPAAAGHLAVGKALAGLFYCLLSAALALAINANLVIHWGYALLVVLVASLFMVSIGLVLGTFIDNRAQLTLWSWVAIMPLIAPMMISLLDDLMPAWLVQVARLTPTSILLDQLQVAFSGSFSLGAGLLQLGWILLWTGLVLLVVIWLLQRRDREEQPLSSLWQRFRPQMASRQPEETFASRPKITSPSPDASKASLPARPLTGWGIIWTIAWKDMREAIQNKLALSIMLGIALVMASSLVMPLLLSLRDTPTAVIYDQGRSTIVAALSSRDELRLRGVDSMGGMQDLLTTFSTPMLGLVLPPDFDQQAGSAETIQLQGYVAHWTKPEEADRLAAFFANQLSRASWGNVEIAISDQRVYPRMEQPLMLGLVQIISILSIGIALVPLLFVEEKESHTLEVLLISPASLRQVVAGKALAGLFFSLLAAAVVLACNAYSIAHWEIALLAALLTGAFAVSIGLLVGAFSDNPTTMGMWGGLILLMLIALLFGGLFSQDSWPRWLQVAFDWSPGSLMTRLFGLATARELPASLVWTTTASLLAAIAIPMAIVVWRMARINR